MATKPKIPPGVRFKEAARRWTKAAANDLKHAIEGKSTSKAPNKRKKHSGGPTKRNPWVKCRTPGCYRRVPELCTHCHKARAGVTDKHNTHCCPGACPRCDRCTLLCPGPCDQCSMCLDTCAGHNAKDTRDDGNE